MASDHRIVSIFGATGFLGRHVVSLLMTKGWRIHAVSRRPTQNAYHLPQGRPGQIQHIYGDINRIESVRRAVEGVDAVINLVGILQPSSKQNFTEAHVNGVENIALCAKEMKSDRVVHVSAIGADRVSDSDYARTKALGEEILCKIFSKAVILRPSVVFGPEDDFLNRFASMAKLSPFLPLIDGGKTLFQPVWVGDVAHAVDYVLESRTISKTAWELGGPDRISFRDIMAFILKTIGKKRFLLPLPSSALMPVAKIMNLIPNAPITSDQLLLLRRDNVVSEYSIRHKRTITDMGIMPSSMETIAPHYLGRFGRG